MSNRRVFPAFLHFDTEWQQSLKQFKIHFWKTAKRTMSTQLSRGTRSALPSCPCTAKDIGQVPSVLSPLVTPRPLQCCCFAHSRGEPLQDRAPHPPWAAEHSAVSTAPTLQFPCHCREKRDERMKKEKTAAFNSHLYTEAEGYKRQTRWAKRMKTRHHMHVPHHPSSQWPCLSLLLSHEHSRPSPALPHYLSTCFRRSIKPLKDSLLPTSLQPNISLQSLEKFCQPLCTSLALHDKSNFYR